MSFLQRTDFTARYFSPSICCNASTLFFIRFEKIVQNSINHAKENGFNTLILDTAGRLQNKANLMKELEKMHRVVSREIPGAPHEVWLVLDATTGQNGISPVLPSAGPPYL
jgi:hypothetical protein